MYRGSSEKKCPVSGAKRLIAFENNVPATLNLTDSVNKSKREIKTQLCHFSFELLFHGTTAVLYQVSYRASLLHTYRPAYVMQMSKFISVQIIQPEVKTLLWN